MTSDTLVNSANGYDIFLAHFLPTGDPVWIRSINTQLSAVQTPGRNIYLEKDPLGDVELVTYYMGPTVLTQDEPLPNIEPGTRDVLILQVGRADGNKSWAHTGNSVGDDLLNAVASDRYGNIYLMGSLFNPFFLGTIPVMDVTQNGGFYIAKINFRGEIKYVKPNLNSPNGSITGQRISIDPYGNLYLTGEFTGTGNLLGNIDLINTGEGGMFFSKYSFLSNIAGKVVRQSGEIVTGGIVKLFGFTRFHLAPLSDSALIQSDGTYLLKDIPYGKYMLYALPELATQENLAPTYYPAVSHWENATTLLVENGTPIFGVDIHVLEKSQAPGSSTLGGMIYESDSSFLFKSTHDIMAKPAKKADVVLVGKTKTSNNVVAYTTTDNNGDFVFNNIPDGSYTVIADIPGMPHESYYDVSVTGGQIMMNLDYLVGEEYIIPANKTTALPADKPAAESFFAYPNPFREDLTLIVPAGVVGNAKIRMFSLTGQMLLQFEYYLSEGCNLVDLRNLPDGMYLLELETNSHIFKEKVIKE